jgi:succinate dehydrogenase / fumarate reductase cytochrome b subunit
MRRRSPAAQAMLAQGSAFMPVCEPAAHKLVMATANGNGIMAETKPAARPLSPHLSIYRPMLTMMMSIAHRITGAALYFGVILLVWWLTAAAVSDAHFETVQGFFGHWTGRTLLLGFTWALVHHALGGIRHLIWDTGRGFDLKTVEFLARANLAGSIAITLLLWIVGYAVRA